MNFHLSGSDTLYNDKIQSDLHQLIGAGLWNRFALSNRCIGCSTSQLSAHLFLGHVCSSRASINLFFCWTKLWLWKVYALFHFWSHIRSSVLLSVEPRNLYKIDPFWHECIILWFLLTSCNLIDGMELCKCIATNARSRTIGLRLWYPRADALNTCIRARNWLLFGGDVSTIQLWIFIFLIY